MKNLASIAVSFAFFVSPVLGEDVTQAFIKCANTKEDKPRLACYDKIWNNIVRASSQPPASDPKAINSTEAAKRFLIGTWVYAQPLTATSYPNWLRWEINESGTVIQQSASPRDSAWGEKKVFTYEVITDKFSDTGERYYGLRLKEDGVKAIITEKGSLYMAIGAGLYPAFFVRGDKNLK